MMIVKYCLLAFPFCFGFVWIAVECERRRARLEALKLRIMAALEDHHV